MNTKEKLNKLSEIICGLSELYAELSEELSENCLRIAYDGARGNSEVKKMPRMWLNLEANFNLKVI